MKTAFEVFREAQRRGLRFVIIDGCDVQVQGSAEVLDAMSEELRRHEGDIAAVAQEWASPVSSAEMILAAARSTPFSGHCLPSEAS
jgi:hypothetical protein